MNYLYVLGIAKAIFISCAAVLFAVFTVIILLCSIPVISECIGQIKKTADKNRK